MNKLQEQLLNKLASYGQEHLVAQWGQLDADQQTRLADEINSVDLQQIQDLYQSQGEEEDFGDLARRADPPPAIRIGAKDNPYDLATARARGQQALRDGKIGVLLVAGGQGSRLGFEHPKGMYPIGPVSNATLFQIHIEKIVATARRYDTRVPLYVMTSPVTDQETRDFFQQHDRFGLAEEDLHVFCQGTMPAVDRETGRLLLSRPDELFLSPDGHGGILKALRRTAALEDMAQRGIEELFYFQVDNPLATICDPEFIGFHLLAKSEYTLQVISKQTPQDRLGNVVSVNSQVRIIEYSDLPDDAAEQRNEDGSLKIWAGSIAVHMLGVEFLTRIANSDAGLPFHRAVKKVPYIDEAGQRVEPSEPNAIKFEQFIFDLLPMAKRSLSVEVLPEVTFAALKNPPSEPIETAEYVQRMMCALHAAWLHSAGVEVADGVRVEISPLFALDVEQLSERVPASTVVSDDKYFC